MHSSFEKNIHTSEKLKKTETPHGSIEKGKQIISQKFKNFESTLHKEVENLKENQDVSFLEDPSFTEKASLVFSKKIDRIRKEYAHTIKKYVMSLVFASSLLPALSQEQYSQNNENVNIFEPETYQYDVEKSLPKSIQPDLDKQKREDIHNFVQKSGYKPHKERSTPEKLPSIYHEFKEIQSQYEEVRRESLRHIGSPTYKQRLSFELHQSGDIGLETFYIEKRKMNLDNDYDFSQTIDDLQSVSGGSLGYHNSNENKTYLEYNKSNQNENIAAHEFQHQSVNITNFLDREDSEEILITPYAQKLYAESFNYEKIKNNLQSENLSLSPQEIQDNLDYFSSIDEIDAYKRGMIYELEKNNIWNYDSEFTQDTIQKIKDFLKDDTSLENINTHVFMNIIKEEALIKIFNTTA